MVGKSKASLLRVNVLKASGEKEPFSEEKVRQSLTRAGLSSAYQDKIIDHLEKYLYEGITTKEIYAFIRRLLRKLAPPVAARYDLKKAIMDLGPTGYPFELFMAGVLRQAGFRVGGSTVVAGHCIDHEVDFLAEKDGERFVGECKFHHYRGVKTDVKTALYVYARFLDIKEAKIGFFHQRPPTAAFLVTNTKLTSKAKTYGHCVGMKMMSWDYPASQSLRNLVEREGLHPITCLLSLNSEEKRALLNEGFVFCRRLLKDSSWYPLVAKDKREKVLLEAKAIFEREND